MTDKLINIVWFRQDLRLSDNPALNAAAAKGRILPIFILDDNNAGNWKAGAASRVWLHHSLQSLNNSLDGGLNFFKGDAKTILSNLIASLPVETVYWNRCYEPWRIKRDQSIKSQLSKAGIEVRSFNASLLWEPWEITKQDGTAYKVFTPFFQKGCLRAPPPRTPQLQLVLIDQIDTVSVQSVPLEDLDLLPTQSWHRKIGIDWSVGESGALAQLDNFCDLALANYRQGRDFPALDCTSRLSPHLHFGEISPHQAWYRMELEASKIHTADTLHFQRELGWREFSYHLLYQFPDLPDNNFNPKFNAFEWIDDSELFLQWQQGKTGYPIVDAGMRELWQTGYMHNRVRMIVASFLIKNMLIDWRLGCRWFWDCLLDADLASNSASWQWCAGSGADAAPYFRIFNPLLQSKKFDPQGDYIARYIPELADLPPAQRHEPWKSPIRPLEDAYAGLSYAKPVLDLKTTRERALSRYKNLA